MHADAERGQFLDIHVAARAGAEEDHVLQPLALAGDLGRQIGVVDPADRRIARSEEHTSELQSLMRISYAVFCLKKKNTTQNMIHTKVTAKQQDKLTHT